MISIRPIWNMTTQKKEEKKIFHVNFESLWNPNSIYVKSRGMDFFCEWNRTLQSNWLVGYHRFRILNFLSTKNPQHCLRLLACEFHITLFFSQFHWIDQDSSLPGSGRNGEKSCGWKNSSSFMCCWHILQHIWDVFRCWQLISLSFTAFFFSVVPLLSLDNNTTSCYSCLHYVEHRSEQSSVRAWECGRPARPFFAAIALSADTTPVPRNGINDIMMG